MGPQPDSRRAGGSDDAVSLVVLAASLGGLGVLQAILSMLPAEFPIPLLLVQHSRSQSTALVEALARFARVPPSIAVGGLPLAGGTFYVAPADRHITFDSQLRCVLSDGAPVNYTRPAADILFQSAALRFGRMTLAVVLSGRLRDGALGALAIRNAGGIVIAQDPTTCLAPGMPTAAIGLGAVDLILPPELIASALVTFAMVPGARALFGFERLPG